MVFSRLSRFLSLLSYISLCYADYGLLFNKKQSDKEWQNHMCVNYNPLFEVIPTSRDNATVYNLVDISDKYGCVVGEFPATVNNSVVIVRRGECTFVEKAFLAQAGGAKALIIASDELLTPGVNTTGDSNKINITVATGSIKDIQKYINGKPDQVSIIYAPSLESRFDPNMIVIFLIATSNIVIGGFWAGVTKFGQMKKQKYKHKREQPAGEDAESAIDKEAQNEEPESVDMTIKVILLFVLFSCAFLLLLYFFYDYLVYVVIALFCLATSIGLFYCFLPLVHKICPWAARVPPNKVPIFRGRPQYRDLALLFICFGVAIFWAVERHAPYAWILQDILGYAFCINVLRSVGLPNLKICTIMLCLLFIYDIFFVFITPLFTSGGDSVMVKVATGGSSKTNEKLPMVFQVPRLTRDVLSACPLPYSLLGFGDVIIPGLLVSHNHLFDLRVQCKRVYYIASSIGYGVGLIVTFVALALMEKGQPALLYLVPCTLLPTYIIGCIRGEVKLLWSGISHSKKDSPETNPTTNNDDNLTSVVSESRNAANSTQAIPRTNSASSSENECKGLLK